LAKEVKMAFFDKLMFWKKKDEFGGIGLGDKNAALGSDLSSGLPSSDTGLSTGTADSGYGLPTPASPIQPAQPSYQQPQPVFQPQFQPSSQPQGLMQDKIDLISSKLDVLKASLESINQRLTNLENIARGEESASRKKYYRY
jgi:hypothetical protein